MKEEYEMVFTCERCGHMLPQSYEEEDGLCYLCVPLSEEERQIVQETMGGE